MDRQADSLDEDNEEILTYAVSDEALERAAGTESRGRPNNDPTDYCTTRNAGC
jgi:hypothetical protein